MVIFVVFLSVEGISETGMSDTMKVETPAEQLFFVTVRIEVDKANIEGEVTKELATGFIVRYRLPDGNNADFLVTSKHVITGTTKGRFFFIASENSQPVLGQTYNIEMDNFEKRWFKHPDNRIDVAIMPLGPILREVERRKWKIYYSSIGEDISLGLGGPHELDAIEEVIFIGYPSGLIDTTNYLPVARRGITATPLSVDYTGLPKFLIDAAVFPGSSGSPVFICNTGSYSDRRGNLNLGSRIIFLGIISDLVARKESGEWEFEDSVVEHVPVLRTQQMIDIGVVFKADAVFDTIEVFLAALSGHASRLSK